MPTNQYDQPVKYQYKSLGLSKFAAPLAAMQDKYDKATDALSDSEFNLKYLTFGTEDPTRAKALISDFEKQRDEIANDLMTTKNFRASSQKLKQLNKAWLKNPEAAALASNYENWVKRNEEERKRWIDGKIKKDAYDYWRNSSIQDYVSKGETGYSNNNGIDDYRTIGKESMLNDMSEDFDKMKIEIAKLQPEHITNYLSAAGFDTDTMSKKFVENLTKEIKDNELSDETEKYLKTLKRFKPWAQQEADINYWNEYGNSKEAFNERAPELVNSAISDIDTQIANLEALSKKNPKLVKDPEYLSKMEGLVNTKKIISEKDEDGNYNENIVRNLHNLQFNDELYSADALGEIMAYKNTTRNWTFKSLPGNNSNRNNGGIGDDIFSGGDLDPVNETDFFNTSRKTVKDARAALDASRRAISKLGGDGSPETARAIGNLVYGSGPDSKKIQANPAWAHKRQVDIYNALNSSNNEQEFKAKLRDAGIKITTDARTNAIFNNFKTNANFREEYSSLLAQSERHYTTISNTRDMIKATNKAVVSSKDFDNYVESTKDQKIVLNAHEVAIAKSKGFKIVEVGTGVNATNVKTDKIKLEMGRAITRDQYAQLYGYKNFKDAASQGHAFKNDNLRNEVYGKKQNILKTNKDLGLMSYTYSGDKGVSDWANRKFSTMEEMLHFSPLNKVDWKNVPGFDAEGRPEEGTKLAIGPNSPVKVKILNNTLGFQVPYVTKGGATTYVDVDFKNGKQADKEALLFRMRNNFANDKSSASERNFQMVNTQLFNVINNSNTNAYLADVQAFSTELGKPVNTTIESVYTYDGNKIDIVKVPINNSSSERKGEYRVFVNGGEDPDFKSEDFDAAKSYIAKTFY